MGSYSAHETCSVHHWMGHLQWHRWITLTRLLTNPVSGTLSNRKVWRNAPAQARNLNATDTFTTRPTFTTTRTFTNTRTFTTIHATTRTTTRITTRANTTRGSATTTRGSNHGGSAQAGATREPCGWWRLGRWVFVKGLSCGLPAVVVA